ncbi:hypothetical protein DPMN_025982 [Dreissena polymorpha]|uniref:Uncharacterized protein n=1 Tax=Dreissena polymorpha TaxID=45954 RepID=A0A9D4LUB2_DREPO|nr:hypothetical protein DPMN_025982 [Dreissena polymorpha]
MRIQGSFPEKFACVQPSSNSVSSGKLRLAGNFIGSDKLSSPVFSNYDHIRDAEAIEIKTPLHSKATSFNMQRSVHVQKLTQRLKMRAENATALMP